MPIVKLYVEGNLDVEVLSPILQGSPALQPGGSKYALGPRATIERQENRVSAGYLRDRDFDFDPPEDPTKPAVDRIEDGVPFGWRWCRHELENYLIEPAIVSEAMGYPVADVEEALRHSARRIRDYEVARWSIGIVRRVLPPNHELKTRPEGLNDLALPQGCNSAAVNAWASDSINHHRDRILSATDSEMVKSSLSGFADRFNDVFITDLEKVLLWFSGKDLLAGMASWIMTRGVPNPGAFRASLRDWVRANAARALELLPEWTALVRALRA